MITEDYVSFETTKLLNKKKFNCSSYRHYRLNDGELCCFNTNCNTNLKQNDYITAPTLQMAMKWLREVYKIDVWVEGWNRRYKGYIHSEQRGVEALFYEDSYEVACEAAIKYCLENLI